MIRLTHRRAIVKHDNRARLPPNTSLKIMAGDHVLHEEILQHSELGLLQALDLRDELAIDEQAFLARHGVHAHKRMHRLDRVFAHQSTRHSGMVDHPGRRMNGLESIDKRLERGG